ncbi:nuclear transport factor 2 family protein [Amycolatopsis sp. FDAARGOS 1241]|uniref:nuclear transport factor 2 family protein n=1 Tax=Amycolatopsis sp. FDAARGOS 1241 TaxID=2778070 RepID=UPI00194EF26E|nr:nuclear transport factor 2 family protein [Amycolatopsis sp. FDAARGOS 1241]QRP43149.1 nuclear transport factor 2 family protein [Amycolatopsis sp. FDAARGOS 1241]
MSDLLPEPGWASAVGQVSLPEPVPGAIADRLLAGELIARYGWAYDERDRAALAACFTPDGVWQGVLMGRDRVDPIRGADAIAAWLAGFWPAQTDQRRHVFTNVVVGEPTGGSVVAHAYLLLLSSHDGTTTPVSAGPYRFTLRRTDRGLWRIAHLEAGFDAPF